MNELSLMERFADPELIQQMTMAEKMQGAGITAIMGLSITFFVLIMIWGLIGLITKVMSSSNAKEAALVGAASAAIAPAAAPEITVTDPAGNAVTDGELIAVISAAIASYEAADTVQTNLNIQRINRTSGRSTSWNTAGNRDAIDSRMM